MSSHSMTFEEALPYLASAYRRGTLVPFIGSGMSMGACTSWGDFVTGLVTRAGLAAPSAGATQDSASLYRLADKALLGLSSLGLEERIEAYRAALNARGLAAGQCTVPPQTQALAQCYWPLVLSTNYDDVYVVSRMKQSNPGSMAGGARTGSSAHAERNELAETDIPEVLGRSVEDCHAVLRSLDSQTRPILWALQGFVGGQAERLEALFDQRVLDPRQHRELARQVVVGHQQYQQAIHTQHHFRRSFAEVFSRRSLLFLGSGILEDYLINLFGEIAHHYGPGPYPHFALFCGQDKKGPPDLQFFQMRLGITPVVYDRYEQLPEFLDQLAEAVGARPRPPSRGVSRPVSWMPDELGFSLADGLHPAARGTSSSPPPRFRLRYAPLPLPTAPGECVIVSVGRTVNDKRPIHGRQATGMLEKAARAGLIASVDVTGWKAFTKDPQPPLAYRFGDAPFFAVAARIDASASAAAHPEDPEDSRDLGIIVDAVSEALLRADQAGFTHVHLGPVASGQYRLWTPIHPFVQTLAGVRQFFARHPDSRLQLIELHVFSPLVWFPVVAGKLPVGEILSSDMMKIWVDVRVPNGPTESFAVTPSGPRPVTVKQLKDLCGLPLDRWDAELIPRSGKAEPTHDDDRLVTPVSIVVFSPRKPVGGAPP